MTLRIPLCALIVLMLYPLFVEAASPPVVDGHHHEGISSQDGVIDLTKLEDLRSRGLDAVIVPLPLDRSATSDLEGRIKMELRELHRIAADHPDFSIAGDPPSALRTDQEAGLRLFFSLEWFGETFAGDRDRVTRFRDLGVRAVSLVESDPDGLFIQGEPSVTLSSFGKDIVSAMNDAGVLIDITHLSHQQKLEVIRQSRVPVTATHSLVQEVNPAPFNLPPDVVSALAETGGSVWVSFNRSELLDGPDESDAIGLLVDHIEVLIERLGEERVGIGSDLQAGGRYVPEPLNRPDALDRIRRALRERGYSQQVRDGVLGENILRSLTAVVNDRSVAAVGMEIE